MNKMLSIYLNISGNEHMFLIKTWKEESILPRKIQKADVSCIYKGYQMSVGLILNLLNDNLISIILFY